MGNKSFPDIPSENRKPVLSVQHIQVKGLSTTVHTADSCCWYLSSLISKNSSLNYACYPIKRLCLPVQERRAHLFRNLLQQMCLLGLQKEGGIQLSGINFEWDSSEIQSMFHVLETLDIKQKNFQRYIPPRNTETYVENMRTNAYTNIS